MSLSCSVSPAKTQCALLSPRQPKPFAYRGKSPLNVTEKRRRHRRTQLQQHVPYLRHLNGVSTARRAVGPNTGVSTPWEVPPRLILNEKSHTLSCISILSVINSLSVSRQIFTRQSITIATMRSCCARGKSLSACLMLTAHPETNAPIGMKRNPRQFPCNSSQPGNAGVRTVVQDRKERDPCDH